MASAPSSGETFSHGAGPLDGSTGCRRCLAYLPEGVSPTWTTTAAAGHGRWKTFGWVSLGMAAGTTLLYFYLIVMGRGPNATNYLFQGLIYAANGAVILVILRLLGGTFNVRVFTSDGRVDVIRTDFLSRPIAFEMTTEPMALQIVKHGRRTRLVVDGLDLAWRTPAWKRCPPRSVQSAP